MLGLALALLSCSSKLSPTSFYNNFSGMVLVDQNGRKLDVAQLLGRTVLVNFVFIGCSSVCPLQTRGLAELRSKLSKEVRARVQLLSISVDPRRDTPAALKTYAASMGADVAGWSFVTGRPEDVERLSQSLRLFRPEPDVRVPDDHTTHLWLIDGKGELRMRYRGNPPDVDRLVSEVTALDSLARAQGL